MKIRGFFGDLKSANETVDKLKKAGLKMPMWIATIITLLIGM